MPLVIKELKRVFKFNDIDLPDPNPAMTETEVLDFYSGKYPELTTGYIKEKNEVEGELIHEIEFSVGNKA